MRPPNFHFSNPQYLVPDVGIEPTLLSYKGSVIPLYYTGIFLGNRYGYDPFHRVSQTLMLPLHQTLLWRRMKESNHYPHRIPRCSKPVCLLGGILHILLAEGLRFERRSGSFKGCGITVMLSPINSCKLWTFHPSVRVLAATSVLAEVIGFEPMGPSITRFFSKEVQ